MTDTPNRPPQRLRIRPLPDQERLRSLFRYDDRGLLFWREKVNSQVDLAKPAGYIGPKGYRHVGLNGVMHKHHRLVWCYFNGDPGNLLIDHINYMPGDDRIENLRLATMSENKRNMPAPTTYSSGSKGSHFTRRQTNGGRRSKKMAQHGTWAITTRLRRLLTSTFKLLPSCMASTLLLALNSVKVTPMTKRLPLWEVLADAFDKAVPTACFYGSEMLARCKAAEIRALRDWLVPEEQPPLGPAGKAHMALRALLTAEADRAERGDHG